MLGPGSGGRPSPSPPPGGGRTRGRALPGSAGQSTRRGGQGRKAGRAPPMLKSETATMLYTSRSYSSPNRSSSLPARTDLRESRRRRTTERARASRRDTTGRASSRAGLIACLGSKPARGVLEIRNSRSYRNACNLCCSPIARLGSKPQLLAGKIARLGSNPARRYRPEGTSRRPWGQRREAGGGNGGRGPAARRGGRSERGRTTSWPS